MLSSITSPGPTGTRPGLGRSSFRKTILSRQTLRRKSSNTWIVNWLQHATHNRRGAHQRVLWLLSLFGDGSGKLATSPFSSFFVLFTADYCTSSISLGRHVLSKKGWSGPHSRRITKQPLPGQVCTQFLFACGGFWAEVDVDGGVGILTTTPFFWLPMLGNC